jgi:hypothetical protein
MRRTGAAMGRGCSAPVCGYPIADLLEQDLAVYDGIDRTSVQRQRLIGPGT